MTGLLSRVLVAAAALPAVLLAVWFGGWWIVGLAAVAAILALHEYYSMIRPLRPLVLAGYAAAVGAIVGAGVGGVEWMLGGWLIVIVLAFVFEGIAGTRQSANVAIGSTVLGAAWVAFGLAHLVLLREQPNEEWGRLTALTVLLAIWAADTFAFFAGRLLGRHKMAPVVSPGKTWEGFVAGTIAAVLVAFFALYPEREEFLLIWESLVLGGILAFAGVLGDLFESRLKRDVGVKDSGRLLGAHGGMLDRTDALLWAAPATYYFLLALDRL